MDRKPVEIKRLYTYNSEIGRTVFTHDLELNNWWSVDIGSCGIHGRADSVVSYLRKVADQLEELARSVSSNSESTAPDQ